MDKNKAERLANSFARAQQLTKIVSTPEFDEYAKNVSTNSNDIDFENYAGETNNNYRKSFVRENINNIDLSNSKLPKEILDEIRKNPLDGLSSDPTMDSFAQKVSEKVQKNGSYSDFIKSKKTINEKQNIVQTNNSTDYEIIKMIVEGTMNKYMEKIEKKLLNESKSINSEINTMVIGKKFKFIDGSGNIYEAVLKYKGNINDIKK